VKSANFAVASNPEFLREGSALLDSLYPDRVVIGTDDPRTSEVLYSLYRPLLDQTFAPPSFLPRPDAMGAVPLISTDLASAELIKYAANAFLSLKISYINEIGNLAEKVGADITKVAKGIGLDRRIGNRFLQAGGGWGGVLLRQGHLGVDLNRGRVWPGNAHRQSRPRRESQATGQGAG
jgi:UDPglucose 6-dehydrogenase